MDNAADPENPKDPVPGAQPATEPARVFIRYANRIASGRNSVQVGGRFAAAASVLRAAFQTPEWADAGYASSSGYPK